MKKFLRDNWIVMLIGCSFLISTVLAIRNNYVIQKNHSLQQQADAVTQRTQEILSKTMHGLDLGVRGYGITIEDQFLIPYKEAVQLTPATFRQLDSLLKAQAYPARPMLNEVEASINGYISFSNEMIEKARNGERDAFLAMLKEDRGYEVWKKYDDFSRPLFEFENDLNTKAMLGYSQAIRSNLIVQASIMVLVFPMLYMFVSKVKTERAGRERVLKEVEKTDKGFVFNPGAQDESTIDINAKAISNIKQASSFIGKLASGNYQIDWPGLTVANASINSETLAGNLVSLRDRLKSLKEEDDRRNWINVGVAEFSEIVRKYQDNPDELSIKCISYLTKYIGAQQGSIFMLEENEGEQYLKLAACYAFDRKKWIDKKIELGSGLIGQAYLEGEPIILTDVPLNYIQITSGLGQANPKFIAIIPMKHESRTLIVAEFASFEHMPEHKISFLRKSGEFLSAAIFSIQTTAQMRVLLQESAVREEQMKQREEELRQNMEELQTLQENSLR